MLIAVVATVLAVAAWGYLLAGHGGYWRTDQRLPPVPEGFPGPARWGAVTAIVPARDEAAVLPGTLPTLLGQDYPGAFTVVLVDDESSDGTAAVAAGIAAAAAAASLRVVPGAPAPAGWTGKVWAIAGAAGGWRRRVRAVHRR